MSSPEERMKHSRRIKSKQKERVRSVIAKELITSGKYKARVITDKRGREHDLEKLDHGKLVKLIQELDD